MEESLLGGPMHEPKPLDRSGIETIELHLEAWKKIPNSKKFRKKLCQVAYAWLRDNDEVLINGSPEDKQIYLYYLILLKRQCPWHFDKVMKKISPTVALGQIIEEAGVPVWVIREFVPPIPR